MRQEDIGMKGEVTYYGAYRNELDNIVYLTEKKNVSGYDVWENAQKSSSLIDNTFEE